MGPLDDTICALSTPPGTGAIAIVRVSGPEAFAMVHALGGPDLNAVRDRKAELVKLADEEGPIDEAVITLYKGPRSYTGQDVAEIAVHGSPYIQQRLLGALTDHGARLARPGEFTMRAFLDRKLDLSQAEAVADLIASSGRAAHKLAMQQLRGGYSKRIEELRQRLVDLCALVELELDFSEEDVEFAKRDDLLALLDTLLHTCTELIASFRYGNAIKQGVPVAILGAPNSGKSTLLNALLEEDRAIVSDIPGTTRDTVEDTISLNGVLFRFIDTAGLRDTSDTIEQLGIDRSYKKAGEAQVVLLLGDATTLSAGALRTQADLLRQRIGAGATIVPVLNKVDLPDASPGGDDPLRISARNGTGLNALKDMLLDHVNTLPHDQSDIVVTNARHVAALKQAVSGLEDARAGVLNGISGELLAIDLRRAQHHLGEITGRITSDDILGSIFGRFCIGK
ncbi:MAG: tRNA uridine-5-carboxymethylaminomethyl(34) synthesis GTPase MnmE [Flavobacteriales bacterium]|nr:tRNA uridine-5-carboxymethylaminomethyl(34) synthesis GTPase MnmE [Flavobacteriales bacterium]